MENDDIIDGGAYQASRLTVSPAASGYLNETGKWSRFLAILGFCFVGLAVIFGLLANTIFSAMGQVSPYPGYMFGVIYAVLGLLYFFPMYYLFKFSTKIRAALARKDAHDLDSAFENLKSHYKFIGIFMIVVLAFYVVAAGLMLVGTTMM